MSKKGKIDYFEHISNIEYKTIKSFNYLLNHKNEEYKMNFYNDNIIIIDEISMVNLEDFYTLLINLSNIKKNIKIVLSGDIRQLPSIGIGDIYNKIIKCKDIFCYNELKILVRSNDELNDSVNDILENKIPRINKCFNWLKIKDNDIFNICSIIPDDYDINKSIIITQTNSYITKFTNDLRNKLNPLIEVKKETKNIKYLSEINIKSDKYFRLNDPVIHTKNINKHKLYNGMTGKIIEILEYFEEINNIKKLLHTIIVVKFKNNHIYNYNTDSNIIEYLEPAYMITVHKSQGQEYDYVYIYFNSEKMSTHNSLYTAITRGKKHVTLICSKNILLHSLNNPSTKNSMMDYMIYFYIITNKYNSFNINDDYDYIKLFKKYYEKFNNISNIRYKNNDYNIDYKTLNITYIDNVFKKIGTYNLLTDRVIKEKI
jgi:exodeoxyribonuclease V alpha subunit